MHRRLKSVCDNTPLLKKKLPVFSNKTKSENKIKPKPSEDPYFIHYPQRKHKYRTSPTFHRKTLARELKNVQASDLIKSYRHKCIKNDHLSIFMALIHHQHHNNISFYISSTEMPNSNITNKLKCHSVKSKYSSNNQ